MPRSSTATPGPGLGPTSKSQISGGHVWVNDWYVPESFENVNDIKLKGWHKVTVTNENHPQVSLSGKDVVDLNNMKYYEEVPILSHSEAGVGEGGGPVEAGEAGESEATEATETKPTEPEATEQKPTVNKDPNQTDDQNSQPPQSNLGNGNALSMGVQDDTSSSLPGLG